MSSFYELKDEFIDIKEHKSYLLNLYSSICARTGIELNKCKSVVARGVVDACAISNRLYNLRAHPPNHILSIPVAYDPLSPFLPYMTVDNQRCTINSQWKRIRRKLPVLNVTPL